MTRKSTLQRYLWIFLVAFLSACGTVFPGPMPTRAPSITPTALQTETPSAPSLTLLPTFTALAIPFSTATKAPPSTVQPTRTPLPASLPKFPLDGYVVLFTKNSDLYFQDGENLPIKLAHTGEKISYPRLSDDNRKVVFSRSDGNTYSINTDGTLEKVILRSDWIASLGKGTKAGILDFIPGTHQLLVKASMCETQDFRSPCSTSLFLSDADTGIIRKLAEFGLSVQQDSQSRTIAVSPDGYMVAVGGIDGVDIVTMDGRMIRRNILPYKPSTPTVLFPSLFWLPDSSGLIVALPNTFYHSSAYDNLPASTIWRYTIDSNIDVQISFDPPPMLDTFQVSPDGHWIVYGGIGQYDNEVYLGNLTDGSVQTLGYAQQPGFSWSPGSKYLIFTDLQSTLGAVGGSPTLTSICHFLQWIDAGHFTCNTIEENILRIRMAEIDGEAIHIYDLGFEKGVEASIYVGPK